MLRLLHFLIVALYLFLPVTVVATQLLQRRRRDDNDATTTGSRLGTIAVTFIAAFAIAVSLCLIYGRATGGHVPLKQMLLATYFAAGLLLLLRGFDAALI